jgi:hypothetical protein
MVVSTVVVVTAIAITGVALMRLQRRVTEATLDLVEARSVAQTGIEYAAQQIDANSSWRAAAAASGGDLGIITVGRGNVHMTLVDPVDGNFTNSASDPVDILSTATVGAASQQYKARLTPTSVPLTCLGAGIVSAGNVVIAGAVTFGTDRLFSNGTVSASASRVWLPVEANGSISGSTYNSTTTTGKAVRQLPGASVFDYYKSIGTQFNTSNMSGRRIELCVFSPGNNPYGNHATNANGIYWIDCGGQDFVIQNCRIVGTLVLLNASSATMVAGSVCWEPAVPGLPALLIQTTSLSIATASTPLSEAGVAVNFNPASTPYNGVSNTTTTDSYPSRIKGLVYCTGDVTIDGEASIDGALVVGGSLYNNQSLTVIYDDRYYYSPPPGFAASTVMTLVPGSYVQITN